MEILIAYGAFQLEPNLGQFWPLAYIYEIDEKGNEVQIAQLNFRFGRVSGQVSCATDQEAIADAKRYHSPWRDEAGNIFIMCEGEKCDIKKIL
ncbi:MULTISPECIES: hypothetical protein [unclassified Burkholderia]|uniref:hypothetical protein n=1 Tax=unclassified Burkholderia TaxID=2613784 RepID=UPI00141FD231|nr:MULTISPECIES: hypothetical protein [unclassified Burkholderia]NIE82661.1 hypothetical protein [Burkholderia sp. Tr-860]NIF61780.1 hypothetical protein [Burkholderia sp. Cy-647]NIF94951.1 hypothetical protein [Burkholderia sp. Ax-1720]